jgi:spore coat polysaccharide biosynthesis protein SpsF (cytidylyltransferase family)
LPEREDNVSEGTPAAEPPTEEDLDRIEQMIESHPADHVVRLGDIGPLVIRLVGEVRRLLAENRRLVEGGRGWDS